ncbi:hypothetical protein N5J77_09055 [Sphingobium yanoikuyae]|jgi:hypothetical protein|uniref:Uncharacterized protein n=1 Tax=Sphingobium yanoikuyae TaxID=13690 RepID=A0AA42WV78_SPHYA|nr:hypothetical protein [Sphingobium yanoikuyae]MDH2131268.1 hypothetical protein [Sphingobium yanoikuyae]MDH2150444.1 hypothetical protein [Sphingobium yanoikuyae]MDH2168558.1 hypothetical protein [Sphingobium yanoikuyae]
MNREWHGGVRHFRLTWNFMHEQQHALMREISAAEALLPSLLRGFENGCAVGVMNLISDMQLG